MPKEFKQRIIRYYFFVLQVSASIYAAYIVCLLPNLAHNCHAQRSMMQDSTAAYRQTDALLHRATQLLEVLAQATRRDSVLVDSLSHTAHAAHTAALEARHYRTAMMSQAAAQTAKRLHHAPNILLFKLNVRDTQLFVGEARRYLREGR
jgi:hypothetical protein